VLQLLAAVWLVGLVTTSVLFVVVVAWQSARRWARQRHAAQVRVLVPAQPTASEQVPQQQRAIA
jgi:hypothetical protein